MAEVLTVADGKAFRHAAVSRVPGYEFSPLLCGIRYKGWEVVGEESEWDDKELEPCGDRV
jgi:hypothetical protein